VLGERNPKPQARRSAAILHRLAKPQVLHALERRVTASYEKWVRDGGHTFRLRDADTTVQELRSISQRESIDLTIVNAGVTTGAVNFPHVDMAPTPGKHRILNVHKNVPGVLRDINRIVTETGANIAAQILATDPDIGYLVMDLDQDVSRDVKTAIAALETNLKTRILY